MSTPYCSRMLMVRVPKASSRAHIVWLHASHMIYVEDPQLDEGVAGRCLPEEQVEPGFNGADPGSSVLCPCTAPWELPSAQARLSRAQGPLTATHLKAAAAHLGG